MKFFAFIVLSIFTLAIPPSVMAQSKYDQARTFLDSKNYKSALPLYKELYSENPSNTEVGQEYLIALMALHDFKKAEELAKDQLKKKPNNPIAMLTLGRVYDADGKAKKATEQYELVLKYINGDDILTQQIANEFSNANKHDWAIKAYERATQVTQVPGIYNAALAKLYNKIGNTEKAISLVIEARQNQMLMNGDESTETTLLQLMGKDVEKQKLAQKAIIKLVNADPQNYYYTYLLTWIFSVQDNWSQALVQIQALEKRSADKGMLLLDFAQKAVQKKEFEVAKKAYSTLVGYGVGNPRYALAKEGLLKLQLTQLQLEPILSLANVQQCAKDFEQYFSEFPDAYSRPILNDYALLQAQYAGNTAFAIALLHKAIQQKSGDKFFIGNCKLQLGDYYILQEKIWDAALMYAQVDKAFREDAMGEDARFRNAKLSYYQNDFDQAQGQLSVLKASTSELIANDALFLSILITENIPPDSNLTALKRFAFADLLLFQNKTKEAQVLLDSVAKAFPKNPLADDILLLHSKIALKQKDFLKSIDYLKQIVEQHGKDVLADDALFQIAEISRVYLNEQVTAQKYYEQLIIDYPGSSFIAAARAQLKQQPI
jgi:predicted Zn-dependent protease